MKQFLTRKIKSTSFIFLLIISISASAVVEYDQDITPDTIYGTGNSNGGFTTDRNAGIEVGIRAKVPFNGTVMSGGDGTYSYDTSAEANPRWNFDWAINIDYDGSTSTFLDDYTYELGLDADPGLGTNFLVFDPITPTITTPFFDHSIGTNATANDGGVEAGDSATYLNLLAANNVLQQSWRYAFFPFPPLDTYDATMPGTYAVYLLVRDSGGAVVARSDIQVLINGAPAAVPPSPPTPVPTLSVFSGLIGIFTLLVMTYYFSRRKSLIQT